MRISITMKIIKGITIFYKATWLFTLVIPAIAFIVMACITEARNDVFAHPLDCILAFVTWDFLCFLGVMNDWGDVKKYGQRWLK